MVAQKRPAPSVGSSSKSQPASTADLVNAQGPNWKKRKQERAQTARFIQTQPSTTVSPSASSSRSVSKDSTPIPAHFSSAASAAASSSKLPTSIELESLVSSRAFQIQSFLRSIKSAKSATTTRAWQLLPRHARRRAASHNLLRLPSRLRSKALAELRSSTTQAKSRSETRKRLPSHGIIRATLRRKKLAERASHPQRRWLETHLWHAKRFRMTTEKGKGKERDQGNECGRWGFVLAETTMMKSHRASWRSAKEFVTVHDASYYSVFRVGVRIAAHDASSAEHFDVELLQHLHKSLAAAGFADAPNLGVNKSSSSAHVLDTILTLSKACLTSTATGEDLINSCLAASSLEAALAPVRIVLLSGTHQFTRTVPQQDPYTYACKEALIFTHPAADLHMRRALKAANFVMIDEKKNILFDLEAPAAQIVEAYASQLDSAPDPWLAAGGKDSSLSKLEKKRRRLAYQTGSTKMKSEQAMDTSSDVAINPMLLNDKADMMRKQGFNIFELIGPRAASLLQAVLRLSQGPSHHTDEASLRQLLNKQHGEMTAMVEVQVNDPRLSYPPRLKPLSTEVTASSRVANTLSSQESSGDNLFWMGADPPRFSKGEIDSRRALNIIPGARLKPDTRDNIVPVVLIRDRLVQNPSLDRFTLIVPRGWGLAFFMSLVATHQSGASSGARVLGQHQLKHQRLELAALSAAAGAKNQKAKADMLSYPHNWLGTQAYAVGEKEAAVVRQDTWGRRPKGKRTEYTFPTHKDWEAFRKANTAEQVRAKLSRDRTGVARPYPFGGSQHWEWMVGNSEYLFGHVSTGQHEGAEKTQPWLVASAASTSLTKEAVFSVSHFASAMVALKLHAVRKGTVMPLSSLMLAPSFEDHLSWVHHLDPIDHPAAVANRNSTGAQKMDKQHLKMLIDRRCEIMQLGRSAPQSSACKSKLRKAVAPTEDVWDNYLASAADPEEMHDRSADWNHAVGTVLDGDYSLGNGKGFGIGAITLRAWLQLEEREQRLQALKRDDDKGRRKPRNPIETSYLLLMREPGTDVVRAVTASLKLLL